MAALALSWSAVLRPTSLGGPAGYVMVSGASMEPGLHTGDLVVTRRATDYHRGDVIAYRVPQGSPGAGATIIHRIVGGNGAEGWIAQGDNRSGPDMWRPRNVDIIGRMVALIPKAGLLIPWLRSPLAIAFFAGLLVFWIVAFDRSEEQGSDGYSGMEAATVAARLRAIGCIE